MLVVETWMELTQFLDILIEAKQTNAACVAVPVSNDCLSTAKLCVKAPV